MNLDSLLEDLQQNPEISQDSLGETLKDDFYPLPDSQRAMQSRWNVRVADLKPLARPVLTTHELVEENDDMRNQSSFQNIAMAEPLFISQKVSSEDLRIPKVIELEGSQEVSQSSSVEPDLATTVAPVSQRTGQDWWALCNRTSSDSPPSSQNSASDISLQPENGRLCMYWIDTYEQSGTLYIFGKVRKHII